LHTAGKFIDGFVFEGAKADNVEQVIDVVVLILRPESK